MDSFDFDSKSGEEEKITIPTGPKDKQDSNVLGILGFIFGLLSVITCCCWGGAFSVPGLILSIIQLKKKKNGLAIAGLVLSIVGLVFTLLLIALTVLSGSKTTEEWMQWLQEYLSTTIEY